MNESRLIGVFVAALGLITLFVLIPIGIVSPSDVGTLALAPEFWPLIIASLFTLMGILLFFLPEKPDPDAVREPVKLKRRAARLAVVLGALFAVYFAVPHLGMVVPAMLVIFGLSWLAGERRWKLLLALSLSIPVLLTLFFVFVASIPIPLGIFEFIYG